MDKVYFDFYHDLYRQTAGFVPNTPLGQAIYPGDFFQIKNREIVVLGNIYLNKIISAENCRISEAKSLNSNSWNLNYGVSKPYSGRGSGEHVFEGQFEYSRQLLSFAKKGSYIFKAESPEAVGIGNWSAIRDELIIKLTQVLYSFREVYVVTESVATSSWTLAVAGADGAELEVATDEENFSLHNIFGHSSSKTIQSKELEFYHRQNKRIPNFFKAKRLGIQYEQLHDLIGDMATKRQGVTDWAKEFFDYEFDYHEAGASPLISVNAGSLSLDVLSGNELNPNTALKYFRWSDTTLDDVNRLFELNG